MSPKPFMTTMMMAMAMAMFSSAEGSRIRNEASNMQKEAAKEAVADQVADAVDQVDSNMHFVLKQAVEQVDTMLAGSNPRVKCCLEAMMEDPKVQKQMSSVQKQMKSTKAESPSLLEVAESSGGRAKVEPWKAMVATLLLASNMVPSFAFDVARVKQAVVQQATGINPAGPKDVLSKAVEAATPVIAAAVLTAGAGPAFAGDAGAGEQIFSGNCAACHAGGQNVVQPEKTLELAALEEYLTGGVSEASVVKQVTNGKNAMPAFGGKLSEADIANVATYVITTAKAGWED
jgi:cytochrome c6